MRNVSNVISKIIFELYHQQLHTFAISNFELDSYNVSKIPLWKIGVNVLNILARTNTLFERFRAQMNGVIIIIISNYFVKRKKNLFR